MKVNLTQFSKCCCSNTCLIANSLIHSDLDKKVIAARHFKRAKLDSNSAVVLQGLKLESIPLPLLEDAVSSLSKYVLTKGDYDQSFGIISRCEFNSILEQLQSNNLLRDIQGLTYTGELNDQLIKLAIKCAGLKFSLITVDSNYGLIQEPDRDTIQNIRCLTQRTIEYLQNKFMDAVPCFDFLNQDFSTSGIFLIVPDSLIYLKINSKNLLSDEIVSKINSVYLEGLSEKDKRFNSIEKLIIFNPRLNVEYSIKLIDSLE